MSDVLATASFGRIEPEQLLDTHLARVFFAAQRQRRSGVLTIDEGELTMHVHITDGVVTYVDRGALAETLGRLLMRQGMLDREEYGLILEQMAEATGDSEVRRFGEVAIQLGMLTEEDLEEALRLQVAAKLQHCLTLDEGLWHFDGKLPPAASQFPIAFEPTLRTALIEDPQSYRWPGLLVAKRTRKMRLEGQPETIADRFGMPEAELRLVKAMDGRPLADLLASRVLPPEEAGVIVVLLLFAGVLDLEAPASQRLDRQQTEDLRRRLRRRAAAAEGTEEMDAISVAVAVREAHEETARREREERAELEARERAEAEARERAEAEGAGASRGSRSAGASAGGGGGASARAEAEARAKRRPGRERRRRRGRERRQRREREPRRRSARPRAEEAEAAAAGAAARPRSAPPTRRGGAPPKRPRRRGREPKPKRGRGPRPKRARGRRRERGPKPKRERGPRPRSGSARSRKRRPPSRRARRRPRGPRPRPRRSRSPRPPPRPSARRGDALRPAVTA
ncbi:MAG: hypothetical protein H6719_28585 [Sandaracinaceae bacterium]|nr:hypothetical protein [Sandaracinaceae bacterium]